ncbi:MAG: hypothetical protein ABI609_16375 [Acidobacteriota bacterium]
MAIGLVAAAMLLIEVAVTRLFSVLFFYHFSFFAISLAMSGLALGGVATWHLDVQRLAPQRVSDLLALLAGGVALGTGLAVVMIVSLPPLGDETLSFRWVVACALAFLPALTAAGAFLAIAFASGRERIGLYYAADLTAAGAACLGAVFLMRAVQGPAVLLCGAFAAGVAGLVLKPGRMATWTCAVLVVLTGAGVVSNVASDGRMVRLALRREPIFERWNEHSRVLVSTTRAPRQLRRILIDRSAATYMAQLQPSGPDALASVPEDVDRSVRYLAYRLGRPIRRAAVIGVGGGADLEPPLLHGAAHIDGYELNGILVDLLTNRFRDFNAIASRPEVSIHHGEARVGLAHGPGDYDVIQASLIDTWAATSSGGFVLSENSLYTLEGWRTFISKLSGSGVLTMTRWLLPGAPAETQRLVALAGEALRGFGIEDASANIFLAAEPIGTSEGEPFADKGRVMMATILVSRQPFTLEESQRLARICESEGMVLLHAPGLVDGDAPIPALLKSATRPGAIAESVFDISVPSDDRPYFFLQVRPSDLRSIMGRKFGEFSQITFNGVRVLAILVAVTAVFALLVVLAAYFLRTGNGTASSQSNRRTMIPYFAGLGLGYVLIQLSLHQRLIIVLGRPTFALSVVLFSMLSGTGIGAALSGRIQSARGFRVAWCSIVGFLALLWMGFPTLVSAMEASGSSAVRAASAGALCAAVGIALGFGFPLGVRLLGGETGAVQRMWAVNGASSIAATALASLVGVSFGSRTVLGVGVVVYMLVIVAGFATLRLSSMTLAPRAEAP